MSGLRAWLETAAAARAAGTGSRRDDLSRHPRARPGLLDLASNDYLDLAADARLREAAIQAAERFGTGAGASRVVTGTTAAHLELERELARLTGQPACLAFASGYAANLGVLTALGDPDTLLITDAHIHASLIDGARLSRSPVRVCPHRDLDALARLLAERSQPRALVVVESIYSVLGDAADLPATAALCAQHGAWLVVDEAHGIGVAGDGRGAVHAAGLAGAEHVLVTATLSKALGSQGGAVLGSQLVREHLVSSARTFLFDTALAPPAAAAAAAACRVIAAEPERVAALHRVAAAIAEAAGVERAAGAVQSLTAASPADAVRAAQRLHQAGILVGCFRPPSVPDGVSRLRLTARAGVEPEAAAAAAEQAARLLRDDSTPLLRDASTRLLRDAFARAAARDRSDLRADESVRRASTGSGRAPEAPPLPSIVFITGTDTGVGKTIVTAALAAALAARGGRVAVYKPVQAGLEEGAGDIDRVRSLAGLEDVHEGIRLRHPMAPVAAAEREGASLPPIETHVEAIARLAGTHDHTLIEGAGGLLVELDAAGRTLADLAAAVLETAGARGMAGVGGTAGAGGSGRALETAGPAGTLVVCRAALGTLNHTELTIEALTRRRVPVVGLVIGAWPRRPGPIELSNRRHFARHRVPLLGAVPEGAGDLEPGAFRAEASAWFADAVSGALGGATGGALGSTAGRALGGATGRALGGTAGGALGGTAGHALGPTAGPSLHTA